MEYCREHAQIDRDQDDESEHNVYKIEHIMNRLPLFATQKDNLFDAILETKELEIFRSKNLRDFSNFHWNTYAKYVIWTAFVWHCIYLVT